ncbi:MAG: DHA2 family efflux MFS transporter permease subunit [bacterium]
MIGVPRRQLWFVLSVAFAAFMSKLDMYIVNVSLPTMSRYFNAGTGNIAWVVISYQLVCTSTMLVFGKLSDRMGLKNVFLWGYAIFTAGSILCGFSPHLAVLVLARCVQGFGGAMMATSSFALIPTYVPAARLGWAFGMVTMAAGLGVSLGAPLGGIITTWLSWRWIFLINLPVGIGAIALAMRAIPDTQDEIEAARPGAGMPFDIIGTVLSFAGMLALVYALSASMKRGWGAPAVVVCLIASAVALAAFVIAEMRARDPIFDLGLFRNPDFSLCVLSGLLYFIVLGGNAFMMPFALEMGMRLTTQTTGLLMGAYCVTYIVISPLIGRLADRLDMRLMCMGGMFYGAALWGVFALLLPTANLWIIGPFLFLIPMFMALFIMPNNSLVMGLAPAAKRGMASGIFQTAMNLGAVLGVSLFNATCVNTIHHGPEKVAMDMPLAKVPQQILIRGISASYTLAAALCVAGLVCCVITWNLYRKRHARQKPA